MARHILTTLLSVATVITVVFTLVNLTFATSPSRKFSCQRCVSVCRPSRVKVIDPATKAFCRHCRTMCSPDGKPGGDPWLKITQERKRKLNATAGGLIAEKPNKPSEKSEVVMSGRSLSADGDKDDIMPPTVKGMSWWGRR